MTDYDSSGSEARHTIRSVSLGTLLRLLRWPFVLLSMVFIPRVMQSETYGRYALFIAIYLMADMITDIGILQVFGRFVPGHKGSDTDERRLFLLHGFLAFGTLLAAAACVPIALVAAVLTGESFPEEWLVPLSLLLIFTRIEGVLFGFIYGLNRIALYSSREVLRSLLLFVGVYVFYRLYGLTGAVWSLVVKELILCVIAVAWTRHWLFRRVRLSWRALMPYVLFAIAFYIPMTLFGVLQRSGAVFIQALTRSPEQVGHFELANQFFLMIVSFLGVVLVTLLPSMSACRENDSEEVIHRWHGNIMSYCGVAVFVSFNALVWFGEPVIALLLGPGFVPVRSLALIMMLALVPGLIAYIGMNYALLDKNSKVFTAGVLTGLAIMVLACFALIPRMGGPGAAWASVAGHSALALVFYCRYRARFRVVLKGYVKALLVGACFAPALFIEAGLAYSMVWFAVTTALFLTIVGATGIVDLTPFRYIKARLLLFVRARSRG